MAIFNSKLFNYQRGIHDTVDGCEILHQLKTVINIPL